MDAAEKTALVECTLIRAAEQLGDITESSMANYYRRFPEAKQAFHAHSPLDPGKLEGQMIENSLYCLMYWFESPGEIKILLSNSVPHHSDTLEVPPQWYAELIETTAEVVATTIPPENTLELTVWDELRSDLAKLIKQYGQYGR